MTAQRDLEVLNLVRVPTVRSRSTNVGMLCGVFLQKKLTAPEKGYVVQYSSFSFIALRGPFLQNYFTIFVKSYTTSRTDPVHTECSGTPGRGNI